MLTIGEMAKRFGLSRSTLLYYDSIGLLRPAERSPAKYRLYSEAEVARMELIAVYRRVGLPLADIARVLAVGGGRLTDVLATRLQDLDGEILARRRQQALIVRLLDAQGATPSSERLDKDAWVSVLRATGLSDEDMQRWHVEFERLSPTGHEEFLRSLGIPDPEVEGIRRWARAKVAGDGLPPPVE